MPALADPVVAEVRAPASEPRVRRPELDGLRALAVALVVLYHVFTGRVSGGVDVFLTLTGFFLTVTLGEQYARTEGFDPLRPIARSLSRLAPAAFVVLAATVLASLWLAPQTRWREILEHLIASVTFTENLRLVEDSIDYTAQDAAASPMQQFWSLSVQVQVLLVLPCVVAAVGPLLRAAGWARFGRPVAVALVGAATAASLAWAMSSVQTDQQAAYFSTLPRLWELGAGALAALLLADRRPGRWFSAVLGWTGVIGLVACGAVLDGAGTFPGWQAGWPVLCAVLILFAADAGGRLGAHRLLSLRPLQWLGLRSYGVYLWHWPILVLYLMRTGRERPAIADGAAIIVAAVLLAALTYRLVERPAGTLLRSRRPAWAVLLVVMSAAPFVAAGVGATNEMDRQLTHFVPAIDDRNYPGARALLDAQAAGAGPDDVELIPPLSVIRQNWAQLPDATCTVDGGDRQPNLLEASVCVLGDESAARRVVMVGDSHVRHWFHPLADISRAYGWQVVTLFSPGCNLSTKSEFLRRNDISFEPCAQWRSGLVDRIDALDPDVVVALGTRIARGEREVLPRGFVEAWQKLSSRGIQVIAMRDSPRHARDVPDCLAELGDDALECGTVPSEIYDERVLDADLPPGVTLLDTRPYFCLPAICPAVIGNVRVYMDDAHATDMYMRTVRPLLEPDFLALTGW